MMVAVQLCAFPYLNVLRKYESKEKQGYLTVPLLQVFIALDFYV